MLPEQVHVHTLGGANDLKASGQKVIWIDREHANPAIRKAVSRMLEQLGHKPKDQKKLPRDLLLVPGRKDDPDRAALDCMMLGVLGNELKKIFTPPTRGVFFCLLAERMAPKPEPLPQPEAQWMQEQHTQTVSAATETQSIGPLTAEQLEQARKQLGLTGGREQGAGNGKTALTPDPGPPIPDGLTEQQRAFLARKPQAPPEDYSQPPEGEGAMPVLAADVEEDLKQAARSVSDRGDGSRSTGRGRRLNRARE